MDAEAVLVGRDGFFGYGLGFSEATGCQICSREGVIRKPVIGVETQGLLSWFNGLIRPADPEVLRREIVERDPVPRIGLCPKLIRFDRLLGLEGGIYIIMRRDVELFLFADVLAPLEGRFLILISKGELRDIPVNRSQSGVGNRKIRIELDCHLVKGNAFGLLALRAFVVAKSVSLQGG